MSTASGASYDKAKALLSVCSYSGSDPAVGNLQIKTLTGADFDTEVKSAKSDGTGFEPVSGLGIAAFEGAGGLYVKADATRGFQIFLIGRQFTNNGAALRAAELAIARLLLPRITRVS